MTIVGLDIGGANLKAATAAGEAVTVPFPLWQQPGQLAGALRGLLEQLPAADFLAVTMTGELADCYPNRAEGVRHILEAVEQVTAGRPAAVWQTAGEFVSAETACEFPELTSAANWHALATWAGRIVPAGYGLLLDIGSTTADCILLHDGSPEPRGLTDFERLQTGELVYTGVRRTPVFAVAGEVPLRTGKIPLAAELFATMRDVWLLEGQLAEDAADSDTADGRSATIPAAEARLRRAFCAMDQELSSAELHAAAAFLAAEQQGQLHRAVTRVIEAAGRPFPAEPAEHADPQAEVFAAQNCLIGQVLISGSGSFLAARIVETHPLLAEAETLRLDSLAGPAIATAACAYALAQLAAERC